MFTVNTYTVIEKPQSEGDLLRINNAIEVLDEIDVQLKEIDPEAWNENPQFRDAIEALKMIKAGEWKY